MYVNKLCVKSSENCLPAVRRLELAGQAALLVAQGDPSVRREKAIQAACLLLVKHGSGPHSKPSEVNPFMDKGQWFRSTEELWRCTGGLPNLVKRLAAGGVLPVGSLGDWSPDFLFGLASSGAVHNHKAASFWQTSSLANRPALQAALEGELPFNCKVCPSKGTLGEFRMTGWAFGLGPDNPEGIGVLAGLLAGGRRMEQDKQTWIGVKAGQGSNAALLQSFGVPFVEGKGFAGYKMILVSPFWGALLSEEMPKVFMQWFENWAGRNRGMCPLLPWAFLRAVWGMRESERVPKGIVPFLIDRNALLDHHGISVLNVRQESLVRFGFMRVDPRLREAWLKRMVRKGIKAADFPVGKIPLDFEKALCHDRS